MYVRRGMGRFRGLGQTSGASTIAATITQIEGVNPAYIANNNPGNLIYVGQAGATMGTGGFAAFPTYAAGYQALLNQIQNYANRGLTIDQMMALYAPAGQGSNDPTSYANSIASALGVSSDATVADAISGSSTVSGVDSSLTDLTDSLDSSVSSIDPTLVGAGIALIVGLLALTQL